MGITDRDRKRLWARAGNRCALCQCELVSSTSSVDDESIVGDECHIIAQRISGPRSDPSFSVKQLHSYENLILLCKTHHKQIDDQMRKYTVSILRNLKREHEEYIRRATEPLQQVSQIGLPSILPRVGLVEKEIGVRWSHRADIGEQVEVIRFQGRLMAETKTENANGPTWFELYRLPSCDFLVHTEHVHRFDYCVTTLHGAGMWNEIDPPLTLEEVQNRFPSLATAAGLPRVRNLDLS